MQPLNPLAVQPIGLGPALDLLGVAGVHQQHLEAVRFEQFIQRDPVDACRFHRHRCHLILPQVGHDLVQPLGVRRELANYRRVLVRADADANPVRTGADVDPRRVPVEYRQPLDTLNLRLDLCSSPRLRLRVTFAIRVRHFCDLARVQRIRPDQLHVERNHVPLQPMIAHDDLRSHQSSAGVLHHRKRLRQNLLQPGRQLLVIRNRGKSRLPFRRFLP